MSWDLPDEFCQQGTAMLVTYLFNSLSGKSGPPLLMTFQVAAESAASLIHISVGFLNTLSLCRCYGHRQLRGCRRVIATVWELLAPIGVVFTSFKAWPSNLPNRSYDVFLCAFILHTRAMLSLPQELICGNLIMWYNDLSYNDLSYKHVNAHASFAKQRGTSLSFWLPKNKNDSRLPLPLCPCKANE